MSPETSTLPDLLLDLLSIVHRNRSLSRSIVTICFIAMASAALAPLLRRATTARAHAALRFAASDGVFVAVIAAALLVCRAPVLAVPETLNQDEAQLLAQLMRFLIEPVPWVGVDPTTSGPLNSYVLGIPMLFGAPPSYATARGVGLACWVVALGLTFFTLRRNVPNYVARLAVLPAAIFLCSATAYDYVHYSSEHLSVALLSVAVFFGSRGLTPGAARWDLAYAGIALGSVPFAKLQAAPIAMTLGIVLLVAIFWRHRSQESWRPALRLCLAASAVPAATLVWVSAYGGLDDFWLFYVRSSLHYSSNALPVRAFVLMLFWGNFLFFWNVAGLIMLAGLINAAPPFRRRQASGLAVAAACTFMAASIGAVVAPGKGFSHYLLLLVVPATFLVALALQNLPWADAAPGVGKNRLIAAAVVLGMLSVQIGLNGNLITWYDPRASGPRSTIPGLLTALRSHSQEDDTLAIWGWMPQYYVESGLAPATRHIITYFVIEPGPNQQHYRRTFLADMKRSEPILLLEAVGPGNFHFEDRATQGVATFSALQSYLDDRYCELRDRRQYRLFLRRDTDPGALGVSSSACAAATL